MLASMRISDTQWDTNGAQIENTSYSIPSSGWIVQPAVSGKSFVLVGGTSSWKTNAPTVAINLTQSLNITGFVTLSANPNDDNVGLWGASPDEQIMRSTYAVQADIDIPYHFVIISTERELPE